MAKTKSTDAKGTAKAARARKGPAPRGAGVGARPRLPKGVSATIEGARAKKAQDVLVLDLRKTGAFADFFVLCTGANPRHVHAIADGVEAAIKAAGHRPSHVEGYQRAEWILIDCFDIIVHVFSPGARQFYGLERLWGTAARMEIPDRG